MQNKIEELLSILENHGFLAYVVGGYVRDTLLGLKTLDIDICTNATPKDIMGIFEITSVSEVNYGSIQVIYKKVKFDITTFRKEIKYEDNRKPIKIKYINELKKDLLRRDFTINTLCFNKNGELLDTLNIKEDLDNKIIKTVGNPRYKLKEDSLRILRAVRFASVLDFEIENKTKHYIKKYGYLLKKLSYNRKKDELNKIFASPNKEKGRKLLLELGLDKYLEIPNLKTIIMCDDILGIWAQLNVVNIYPFTKLEKEQMEKIQELLEIGITKETIYKYDLYLSIIAADIKKINKAKITKLYNELPIYSQNDIDIKSLEIASILNKKPGSYIKDILRDIEFKIINNELENKKEILEKYIVETYS